MPLLAQPLASDPKPPLTQEQVEKLLSALARLKKMQSWGASFLSNASYGVKEMTGVLAELGIDPESGP